MTEEGYRRSMLPILLTDAVSGKNEADYRRARGNGEVGIFHTRDMQLKNGGTTARWEGFKSDSRLVCLVTSHQSGEKSRAVRPPLRHISQCTVRSIRRGRV